MHTLSKIGHVAAMVGAMTVSSWIVGHPVSPTMPLAGSTVLSGAMITAHEGESTGQLIQAVSQACHAQPAAPGVRPPFIPASVIVVRSGRVSRVSLASGLSSPGDVVAWCP